MTILYWLEQITPEQQSTVGEKAFTLSQVKQAGYPVQAGFVIPSSLVEEFLSSLNLDFVNLDVDNYQALQSFAYQSRQEILNATFPQDWLSEILTAMEQLSSNVVALRPSLAGNWETILSTQFCACTTSGLALGLKKTCAELFRAKTLFLVKKQQIRLEELKLAILVQSCHQAIASGITEIHPSWLSIQATWGDELALHQGEVLADLYRVNRFNRELETQELGNKVIAYRLNSNLDGLERQLINETEQKNYVLNPENLSQLIEVSFNLIDTYPNLDSIHWSWSEGDSSQYYITSLRPYLASGLILKGIGASWGEAIAPAQVLSTSEPFPGVIPGQILVLTSINLDWLHQLKQAAGIIVESGGLTSHVAIIARELGIPAIVGATQATQLIKTGQIIKINGETGEICEASLVDSQTQPESEILLPSYPLGTQLLVNISQLETVAQIAHLPIDGVGLLRSEFFFLELLQTRPLIAWLTKYKSELQAKLLALLEFVTGAFAPKPVFYRSLNWYALELQSYLAPFQAERKIKQDLFTLELQTILTLRKKPEYNINLLLPFVRSVTEFKYHYQQVQQSELTQHESFKIWIMAEIPSVIFTLPEYVEAGVQGISIGTNDLSQFLLGINRDDSYVPPELTANHPAIKRAIKQLIDLAKQTNISCSICGQITVDYPEIIPDLVRWGIESISVEPKAIQQTYWAIARAEQKFILDMARKIQKMT